MDDRNTNKPGLENDSQLPLDFEEAARVMSGKTAYVNQTAPAPEHAGEAAFPTGQPTSADVPEAAHAGLDFIPAFSPTPAPYHPAPPVQVVPPPISDASRKPSKTLADELSKSKAGLQISLGSSLRDMRESRGISLQDVAEHTKIRKDYLEALELEDFKRLPPAVFVCGYVRKICEMYQVPREVNDDVIRQLKAHADYGLGEEGIEQIIEADPEIYSEADQRTRRIFLVSCLTLVVLGGIVVGIVALSLSGRENPPPVSSGGPAVVGVFNADSLKELNPPQVIRMSELPLPEN